MDGMGLVSWRTSGNRMQKQLGNWIYEGSISEFWKQNSCGRVIYSVLTIRILNVGCKQNHRLQPSLLKRDWYQTSQPSKISNLNHHQLLIFVWLAPLYGFVAYHKSGQHWFFRSKASLRVEVLMFQFRLTAASVLIDWPDDSAWPISLSELGVVRPLWVS